MITDPALFPALLGERWHQLATPVQQMHGDTPHVLARGAADVEGATNLPIRWLRRLLGLPEPGLQQPLALTIERRGTREIWIRRFTGKQMRSVLDRVTSLPLLSERLGPITLHVLGQLGRGWTPVSRLLRAVPKFLRDPAYRWVARHRYRLFGRREQCRLPDAAHAARFLD